MNDIKKMSLDYATSILPDITELKLTQQETKFIAAYCLNGFNKVEAVKEAGYKLTQPNKIKTQANNLLKKDKIKKAIEIYIEYALEPYKEKYNFKLLQTYSKRAFYDITIFYDEDGELLPLHEIKKLYPEWVCVIDNVKMIPRQSIAEEQKFEYTFANKEQALKQMQDILKSGEGDEDHVRLPEETRERIYEIFQYKSPLNLDMEDPNENESEEEIFES